MGPSPILHSNEYKKTIELYNSECFTVKVKWKFICRCICAFVCYSFTLKQLDNRLRWNLVLDSRTFRLTYLLAGVLQASYRPQLSTHKAKQISGIVYIFPQSDQIQVSWESDNLSAISILYSLWFQASIVLPRSTSWDSLRGFNEFRVR